jgi:vacuolar-type H+-ATPase subunit E/Vma4
MARGFESKSVQSQWQDAEEARERRAQPQAGPEDLERRRKREGIEMSFRRVERELRETTSDRRREQLRRALEHLTTEMMRLDLPE